MLDVAPGEVANLLHLDRVDHRLEDLFARRVLEPDGDHHDFPDAVAVFGVNVFALGFAHLLEDHLLRRLCGDAPEILGRPGELDLHVHFRLVPVELLRLGERDLIGRVRDFFDDALDGAELDLAGLGVEARAQRLVLVALARGRLDRVLHSADDDLRLDPFFFGDRVDLL